MFKAAKNIDSAFRSIRLFSIIVIIACSCVCMIAIIKSFRFAGQAQERIYILANGKALEALAADRKDNVPVEARDHVKTFHHDFFSLDPDDKVIQQTIGRALYLGDRSAKQMYDNLRENGYYTTIISGNISQEIADDSITIDINQYPYYFRYYGKQKIIRPSTIVTRNIVTEGWLRHVARSDNNPHGFLIERWKTISNEDINTQRR